MASRQLPERRNHQTRPLRIKGEAGQTQLIGTAANPGGGVQVTTHVQQPRLRHPFGHVAQPEMAQTLRRLLGQAFNPAVLVMVATDQHHRATTEIGQRQQGFAQGSGDADPGMHEITQHEQALR